MHKRWFLGPLFEEETETGAGGGQELPPVPEGKQPDPELEELKARLARTEAAVRNQPVPQPRPQAQPQNPQDLKKAAEAEFWKDPLGTMQQFGNVIAQNIQAAQAAPLAGVAREQARKSDPELFDALSLEIEQNMQGVPDNYKTNPTMWGNAFNMAKGQNMDKVLALRGQKAPAGQGDGPVPAGNRPSPAQATARLSAEEATFARKMKLTPDQYAQGKEFHNDQDKMWSKVITFDSDISRREKANAGGK